MISSVKNCFLDYVLSFECNMTLGTRSVRLLPTCQLPNRIILQFKVKTLALNETPGHNPYISVDHQSSLLFRTAKLKSSYSKGKKNFNV